MHDKAKYLQALVDAQGKLYSVIFALVGNAQDAMDILQDANAALIKKADDYPLDPAKPLMGLFRSFVLMQVRSWREGHKRDRVMFNSEIFDTLAAKVTAEEPAGEDTQARDIAFLRECMKKLPPDQAQLLKENAFENKSVGELSKARHVTVNSLSVFLFRIRQALKRCIEKARQRFTSLDADNPSQAFQSRLECVLEGNVSQEELGALMAEIEAHPDWADEYYAQAQLFAFMQCCKNAVF